MNSDFGCHTKWRIKNGNNALPSFNSIKKNCSTNCEWAIGCGFFSQCLFSFRSPTLVRPFSMFFYTTISTIHNPSFLHLFGLYVCYYTPNFVWCWYCRYPIKVNGGVKNRAQWNEIWSSNNGEYRIEWQAKNFMEYSALLWRTAENLLYLCLCLYTIFRIPIAIYSSIALRDRQKERGRARNTFAQSIQHQNEICWSFLWERICVCVFGMENLWKLILFPLWTTHTADTKSHADT